MAEPETTPWRFGEMYRLSGERRYIAGPNHSWIPAAPFGVPPLHVAPYAHASASPSEAEYGARLPDPWIYGVVEDAPRIAFISHAIKHYHR